MARPVKEKLSSAAASLLVNVCGIATAERLIYQLCQPAALRRGFHTGSLAYHLMGHLKGNEIRLADLGGYKLFVDIREDRGLDSYFFHLRQVPWIIPELLSANDLFVDIGANMGHWTLFAAHRIGPGGKVYAFEPNPKNSKMLADSIQANDFSKRAIVDGRACWNVSNQKLTFFLSDNPQNSGTSSLIDHGVGLSAEKTITVTTLRLDDHPEIASRPSFRLVKIDVERAELQVLQGMERLLSNSLVDFVTIELVAGSEAQTLLQSKNYTGYWIRDNPPRLKLVSHLVAENFGDFIFVSSKCLQAFEKDFHHRIEKLEKL
jgi:FkbM family methyltransferase